MKNFDVIVIGSGISGLNFVLRAAEKWNRVLVITKKRAAESGTNFAQGGIAAVLSKVDNFSQHVKDTMQAGSFHNNRRAVEFMVKHGPQAIMRLIELGVPFATLHGELLLTREGGHGQRRIAFVSDYTGQAIEEVLVKRVKQHPRIRLMEHTFAVDLLVKNRRCYGVQILRGAAFENLYAGITVLATGGIGQLYSHTTNPDIATGDGLAMAYRAGCSFRDCEFVQFHPTTLALPTGRQAALAAKDSRRFLISEAVRGEGAYLRNSRGERFMKNIHPLAELAPRDVVSRAVFEEEKKGPVFLDLRHANKKFLETRFPQIYTALRKHGIAMERDLVPITPAAHYMCGGVAVNLRGETGIKNLYAFGEVAGTGVHGANRLASNSLLEALVFSDRILRAAPQRSAHTPAFVAPRHQRANKEKLKKIRMLRKNLQATMWNSVGIVRTKTSLMEALDGLKKNQLQLDEIESRDQSSRELQNMITTATLIAKAALKRTKSLGCHQRNN